MRNLLLFFILFIFEDLCLAKKLPEWTSESTLLFNSTQTEYKTEWQHDLKFDDHTLVIKFDNSKENIKTFKIKGNPELQLRQWYRDSQTRAPTRRQLKESVYPLTDNILILSISDDRLFKAFEDDIKNKTSKVFKLNLELTNQKNIKYDLTIYIEAHKQKGKTPYANSFLNTWYSDSKAIK